MRGVTLLGFFSGAAVGVCCTLIWTIHHDLGRISDRIELDRAMIERLRITNEVVARAKRALDECMERRQRLGYTLWEVHEMDRVPTGLEQEPEKLCASLGSHSALRADAVYDGHEIWNNASGRVVVGCRYVKLKEEP